MGIHQYQIGTHWYTPPKHEYILEYGEDGIVFAMNIQTGSIQILVYQKVS